MISTKCNNECLDEQEQNAKVEKAKKVDADYSKDTKNSTEKVTKISKNKQSKEEKNDVEIHKEEPVLGDDVFKIYEEPTHDENNAGKTHYIRNKKGIIVAGIVLIIFVIVGVLYISKRVRLDHFDSALYEGQYETASALYNSFNDKEKEEADDMVITKIESILENYYEKEGRDAEFAIKEYNNLLIVNSSVKDKIYEKLKFFDTLKESEKCYKEAEEYFSKKEYKQAILSYNKVAEDDKYYDASKKRLASAVGGFKKEKFEVSDAYAEDEEYDLAIAVMDECLKLLSEDSEIIEKRESYVDAKLELNINDIIDNAWLYMAKSKYTQAVCVLKDAMEEYDNAEALADKLDEYKGKILEKAEEYAQDKDYDNAGRLIEEYLLADPEDEDMKAKLEEYKPSMEDAVILPTLKIQDASGSYYVLERTIEVFGYENIDNGGAFSVGNDSYKSLKGILSYSNDDYVIKGKGILIIKADDDVIKKYTLSETSEDVVIETNIPDCSKISFVWHMADNTKLSYGLVLNNFKFYKNK